MVMKKIAPIMLLLVFLASLISSSFVSAQNTSNATNTSSANATTPNVSVSTEPQITFISPKEGSTVSGPDVIFEFAVSNFKIVAPSDKNEGGKGHLHGYLDDGSYTPIENTKYKEKGLSAGKHKFRLELQNNDHTIISPKISNELLFTVSEGGAAEKTSSMGKPFQRREIEPDKLKAAQEKLKFGKDILEKAKKEYQDAKDQFKKTKKLEHAKTQLLKFIDRLSERVNKLKERVGISENLSPGKSEEVLADLDKRLEKINDWKTKIQNATTKEQLKPLAKEIKEVWSHFDHLVKVHELRLQLEHFGGILKQAIQLDKKLNRWVKKADENNVTIPEKALKVANFESKLADAKRSYNATVDDFKKLKQLIGKDKDALTDVEIAERKALSDSLNNNLKAAKKSLKEAREILVGLAKDIANGLKTKAIKDSLGNTVQVTQSTILNPTILVPGVDDESNQTSVGTGGGEEL